LWYTIDRCACYCAKVTDLPVLHFLLDGLLLLPVLSDSKAKHSATRQMSASHVRELHMQRP